MTETARTRRAGKRKRTHAAAGSRVLFAGLSTSATIGLAGMLAANAQPTLVAAATRPAPAAKVKAVPRTRSKRPAVTARPNAAAVASALTALAAAAPATVPPAAADVSIAPPPAVTAAPPPAAPVYIPPVTAAPVVAPVTAAPVTAPPPTVPLVPATRVQQPPTTVSKAS
jgi:hypothetical protein